MYLTVFKLPTLYRYSLCSLSVSDIQGVVPSEFWSFRISILLLQRDEKSQEMFMAYTDCAR